jgi:phycoerythrin-associated linker protein
MQTFVNPVVNPNAKLGMGKFDETAPVELGLGSSAAEVEVVIRAAYRQVLGNAHVMESERLVVLESQLHQGDISVRQFVRELAKSALYQSRFFDACSRYRSIELNFKHLLGRAPGSYEEISSHSDILDRGGFDAEIDAYIDSDEYQSAFGEYIVPYYRGHKTQTGKNLVGFTHMFQLLRGAPSSDKDLTGKNPARLNSAILKDRPSKIQAITGAADNRQPRDANDILAELFKPQGQLPTPPTVTAPPVKVLSRSHQEIQQQQQLIATLEQQLADLRPLAAIGASQLRTTWGTAQVPESTGDLIQQQLDRITYLQTQIADARRYAAIGESRLNKWQRRVFRG